MRGAKFVLELVPREHAKAYHRRYFRKEMAVPVKADVKVFGIGNVERLLRFRHRTSDLSTSFAYLPLSRSNSPYHTQITSDCLVAFSLSLITTIVDSPLRYQVAFLLSPYLRGCSYPVRLHRPTKQCYYTLGLCPLASVALPARSCLRVYKLYQYST